MRKGAPYVEGSYNDIDPGLNPALQDHYRITPSPGGPGDQYGRWTRLQQVRSEKVSCSPGRLANSILARRSPGRSRDRDQIVSRGKKTSYYENTA